MGTLNFASGTSVTIRVKRSARSIYRSTVSIPNYGVSSVPTASAAAWLGRVEVLDPPAGLTNITAADAGGRARVTPRSDGKLTVDMLRHDGDASNLTISLSGTRSGTPVTEALVVPVSPLQESQGQGTGRHPALHVTGTSAVYYPSTNHRRIYISLAGFTKAEIEAREGISNATGGWLAGNNAKAQATPGKGFNPGGAFKYGETPDLALDADRARQLGMNGLPSGNTPADRLRTVEIAFRKGDNFAGAQAINAATAVGRGPLHPSIVRTYGADEDPNVSATSKPVVGGVMSGGINATAANWIIQGLNLKDSNAEFTGTPYVAIVDVRCDNGGLSMRSSGGALWGLTAQYFVSTRNVFVQAAGATGAYAEKSTHETAIYVSSGHSTLLRDSFLFHAGWAPGYDFNISAAFPDPPEQWSQNGYFSSGGFNVDDAERVGLSKDLTLANVMSTEAAANGLQLRPGGVIVGGFYGRSNVNMLIGGGPDLSPTLSDGNYSYAWGFVVSGVAYKATSTGKSPTSGTGLSVGGLASTLDDFVVANIGDLHPPTLAFTQFKPSSPAVKIKSEAGVTRTPRHNRGVVWNWTDSATSNPNGVPTADLDSISAPRWLDQKLSRTGSTWEDFNSYCETHDRPWEIEAEFRSWARARAGYNETPRTTPQTCVFRPHATIPTPGCRFDIPRDWVAGSFTGKLDHTIPGTVPGDSVNLDGHWVSNYLTLQNDLVNFNFGKNGHLYQVGGHLAITGAVTGTGTLETDQRGIVKLDGPAVNLSTVAPVIGGRLENHGMLTGATTYDVHGYGEFLLGVDGADFTLPSGAALTLDGPLARAGWDGGAGGVSTARFQTGSTVRIRPGLALEFTGFNSSGGIFVPGTTLTGAISGATARVCSFWHFSNTSQTAGAIYLDRVSGTFQPGENLIGSKYDTFSVLSGQPLGQVAAVTVMVPYLRKERFGGFGTAAPNVVANVTLGGAWEVDVTNIANGTHTLLDCDTVTGRPSGFTAPGLGGSRNATLAVGPKTVTLTLAAGTGQTVLA